MKIQSLGHVVLKVRNLERALQFYQGVLGLTVVARASIREMPMAFFSIAGNHHDLALMQVGEQATVPASTATGLAHLALKIGDDLTQLRAARAHLEAHHVVIDRTVDHRVSQSLYVRDADGNVIELFIDADPSVWRNDPTSVAYSEPFVL